MLSILKCSGCRGHTCRKVPKKQIIYSQFTFVTFHLNPTRPNTSSAMWEVREFRITNYTLDWRFHQFVGKTFTLKIYRYNVFLSSHYSKYLWVYFFITIFVIKMPEGRICSIPVGSLFDSVSLSHTHTHTHTQLCKETVDALVHSQTCLMQRWGNEGGRHVGCR